MGVAKKSSEVTGRKGRQSSGTIVYKTKTSRSSFPDKVKKANKLLSRAKLIK